MYLNYFVLGLSSFNNEFDNTILACPDKQAGHVIIRHYDKGKTTKVKAHQSSLSFLELNQIGNKLASTSEKVDKNRNKIGKNLLKKY